MSVADMRSPPSPLRLQRLMAGLRIYDVMMRTGLSTTRISEIERARQGELDLIQAALREVSS